MARRKSNGEAPKIPDPSADASQRSQAIQMAMEQIQKQYGAGAVMKFGEKQKATPDTEVIPTGSLPLDIALGIGGLPRGRVIEIYGPEASGKTTIALSVIAEAQKMGGIAAFVDAEHALDPVWAKKLGVNLEELLISQPDTGEQALEIAEQLIRSGGIDVLVVDSVAALVPKAEIEGEMGDAVVGLQARLMSQALRKLTGVISKSKTAVIFTNQLRQKIGIMFGNPETTPGGLALKFYASVRLDTRRIETLKQGDKVIGSRTRVKVVKNKLSGPFRIAEFDVMADEGISKEGGIIDVGVECDVIQKSGAFYKYEDDVIGQGKEAAKAYLRENPDIKKKIISEIKKKTSSGAPLIEVGADNEGKED